MFVRYQHVERLGTTEVEGINVGDCYIFPKLDGTNGCVWWNDGIKCGSRNRELALEDDNQGFMERITADERYEKFFMEYPEATLYGEWLVPHTFKGYRDDAWRKFYIFDVRIARGEGYISYDEWEPLIQSFDLDYIPALAVVTNPTEETLYSYLEKNTFLCKDGEIGEGIVIKNYGFTNKYDRMTWAKIVRNEFKEKHVRSEGCPKTQNKLTEHEIVEQFCTKAFIEKEQQKIINDKGDWSSKYIPELLGRVWHEFIKEEAFNFIKKFKNPTINFKTMQACVVRKIKKELGIC